MNLILINIISYYINNNKYNLMSFNKSKNSQNIYETKDENNEDFVRIISIIKEYSTDDVDELQGENLSVINSKGQGIIHEIIEDDFSFTPTLKYQIIYSLINKDVLINISDNNGDTPLLLATKKGLYNIVDLLINNGADINIVNKNGINILLYTILGKNEKCRPNKIKKLIDQTPVEITSRESKVMIKTIIKIIKEYRQLGGKKLFNEIENIFDSIIETDRKKNVFYDIIKSEESKYDNNMSNIKQNKIEIKKEELKEKYDFRDRIIEQIKNLLEQTIRDINIVDDGMEKNNLIGTKNTKFIDIIKEKYDDIIYYNLYDEFKKQKLDFGNMINKIDKVKGNFSDILDSFKQTIKQIIYMTYYLYRDIGSLDLVYNMLNYFSTEEDLSTGYDYFMEIFEKIDILYDYSFFEEVKEEYQTIYFDEGKFKDKNKDKNIDTLIDILKVDSQMEAYIKENYKYNKKLAKKNDKPYNYPFIGRPEKSEIDERIYRGWSDMYDVYTMVKNDSELLQNQRGIYGESLELPSLKTNINIIILYISIHSGLNFDIKTEVYNTNVVEPKYNNTHDEKTIRAMIFGLDKKKQNIIINTYQKLNDFYDKKNNDGWLRYGISFFKSGNDKFWEVDKGDDKDGWFGTENPVNYTFKYDELYNNINVELLIYIYTFICKLHTEGVITFNEKEKKCEKKKIDYINGAKFALKIFVTSFLNKKDKKEMEKVLYTFIYLIYGICSSLIPKSFSLDSQEGSTPNRRYRNRSIAKINRIWNKKYKFSNIDSEEITFFIEKISYFMEKEGLKNNIDIDNGIESLKQISCKLGAFLQFTDIPNNDDNKLINKSIFIIYEIIEVFNKTINVIDNPNKDKYIDNSNKLPDILIDTTEQKYIYRELSVVKKRFESLNISNEQLTNVIDHFDLNEPITLPLRGRNDYDKKTDPDNLIHFTRYFNTINNKPKINSWIEFIKSGIDFESINDNKLNWIDKMKIENDILIDPGFENYKTYNNPEVEHEEKISKGEFDIDLVYFNFLKEYDVPYDNKYEFWTTWKTKLKNNHLKSTYLMYILKAFFDPILPNVDSFFANLEEETNVYNNFSQDIILKLGTFSLPVNKHFKPNEIRQKDIIDLLPAHIPVPLPLGYRAWNNHANAIAPQLGGPLSLVEAEPLNGPGLRIYQEIGISTTSSGDGHGATVNITFVSNPTAAPINVGGVAYLATKIVIGTIDIVNGGYGYSTDDLLIISKDNENFKMNYKLQKDIVIKIKFMSLNKTENALKDSIIWAPARAGGHPPHVANLPVTYFFPPLVHVEERGDGAQFTIDCDVNYNITRVVVTNSGTGYRINDIIKVHYGGVVGAADEIRFKLGTGSLSIVPNALLSSITRIPNNIINGEYIIRKEDPPPPLPPFNNLLESVARVRIYTDGGNITRINVIDHPDNYNSGYNIGDNLLIQIGVDNIELVLNEEAINKFKKFNISNGDNLVDCVIKYPNDLPLGGALPVNSPFMSTKSFDNPNNDPILLNITTNNDGIINAVNSGANYNDMNEIDDLLILPYNIIQAVNFPFNYNSNYTYNFEQKANYLVHIDDQLKLKDFLNKYLYNESSIYFNSWKNQVNKIMEDTKIKSDDADRIEYDEYYNEIRYIFNSRNDRLLGDLVEELNKDEVLASSLYEIVRFTDTQVKVRLKNINNFMSINSEDELIHRIDNIGRIFLSPFKFKHNPNPNPNANINPRELSYAELQTELRNYPRYRDRTWRGETKEVLVEKLEKALDEELSDGVYNQVFQIDYSTQSTYLYFIYINELINDYYITFGGYEDDEKINLYNLFLINEDLFEKIFEKANAHIEKIVLKKMFSVLNKIIPIISLTEDNRTNAMFIRFRRFIKLCEYYNNNEDKDECTIKKIFAKMMKLGLFESDDDTIELDDTKKRIYYINMIKEGALDMLKEDLITYFNNNFHNMTRQQNYCFWKLPLLYNNNLDIRSVAPDQEREQKIIKNIFKSFDTKKRVIDKYMKLDSNNIIEKLKTTHKKYLDNIFENFLWNMKDCYYNTHLYFHYINKLEKNAQGFKNIKKNLDGIIDKKSEIINDHFTNIIFDEPGVLDAGGVFPPKKLNYLDGEEFDIKIDEDNGSINERLGLYHSINIVNKNETIKRTFKKYKDENGKWKSEIEGNLTDINTNLNAVFGFNKDIKKIRIDASKEADKYTSKCMTKMYENNFKNMYDTNKTRELYYIVYKSFYFMYILLESESLKSELKSIEFIYDNMIWSFLTYLTFMKRLRYSNNFKKHYKHHIFNILIISGIAVLENLSIVDRGDRSDNPIIGMSTAIIYWSYLKSWLDNNEERNNKINWLNPALPSGQVNEHTLNYTTLIGLCINYVRPFNAVYGGMSGRDIIDKIRVSIDKIKDDDIVWRDTNNIEYSLNIDVENKILDIERIFDKDITINELSQYNKKISKTGAILLELYSNSNTNIDNFNKQLDNMFDKDYEKTLLKYKDMQDKTTEKKNIKEIMKTEEEYIEKIDICLITNILSEIPIDKKVRMGKILDIEDEDNIKVQSGGFLFLKYQQIKEDEKWINLPYSKEGNIPDPDDRMIEHKERFIFKDNVILNSWYENDPNLFPKEVKRNKDIGGDVDYFARLSRQEGKNLKKRNYKNDDIKITKELYEGWFKWLHKQLKKPEKEDKYFKFENIKYLTLFGKIEKFWIILSEEISTSSHYIDEHIYNISERRDENVDWCVLLNLFNYIIENILLLLMFDKFIKDIKLINFIHLKKLAEDTQIFFQNNNRNIAKKYYEENIRNFTNKFDELNNDNNIIDLAKELYQYVDNTLKILNKYFSEKLIKDFNLFEERKYLLLKKMNELKNIFDDQYKSDKSNIDNLINKIFKNKNTFKLLMNKGGVEYEVLKERRKEIQLMKLEFKNSIKKINSAKLFDLVIIKPIITDKYPYIERQCGYLRDNNEYYPDGHLIDRIFNINPDNQQISLKSLELEEVEFSDASNFEMKSIINTENSLDTHLDIIKHRIINDIVNNIYLEKDDDYSWNRWLQSEDDRNDIEIQMSDLTEEINDNIKKNKNEKITTLLIAKIVDNIIISKIISLLNKSLSKYMKKKFSLKIQDKDGDIPKQIPDPDANEPDDWDDEGNGEWVRPLIDNPEYKESREEDLLIIDSGFKLRFNKLLKNMVKYYGKNEDKNNKYSELALLSSSILLEGVELTGFENEQGYFKKYVIKEDLNSGNNVYCKVVNMSLLRLLKEKGINSDIKDKKKQNILFYIINSNNYKLLKKVLDTTKEDNSEPNNNEGNVGFNIPVQTIDSKNYKNITPLHYLVKKYIGYINKYKKNPTKNSFRNNYYQLYRESNDRYRKQILSDPKYQNNLPTYYKIILPMVLTMHCLNLDFDIEKNKNNNNFERKEIEINHIIDNTRNIPKNKVISDVVEQYNNHTKYRNDEESKQLKSEEKMVRIGNLKNVNISKLFDDMFNSFNTDNELNDIFSYNEMWKKLMDEEINDNNENDILNKKTLLGELDKLKQTILENNFYPDYKRLSKYFEEIKNSNNMKKKYIYMIGKINKKDIIKNIRKYEIEKIHKIYSHVVRTVILGSLYLVLLKTCTKFITNTSDVSDETMGTLNRLNTVLYKYLIGEHDISNTLVKDILGKTKMGKDDDYNFGIDSIFFQLSKMIQTNLNIEENSILLTKIKDNIYPLYEETLLFFVPEMANTIKKIHTILINNHSYSEMMCIILDKACKEKKNANEMKHTKKWWVEDREEQQGKNI